jgi:hypothetical protein
MNKGKPGRRLIGCFNQNNCRKDNYGLKNKLVFITKKSEQKFMRQHYYP